MTNNNILTPNSEYWKDNAIETFKGNSDLFVDFLQERDRHSAWIETQITDVQFEAMFAEPMYIADDAKKYSIPQKSFRKPPITVSCTVSFAASIFLSDLPLRKA